MGKSAPEPPPVPDPVATAAAQTQSNLATARTNATLNRVDQFTPYGSSTWTPLANTYVADELAKRKAAYDADPRSMYTGPLTTTVTTPGTERQWVETAGDNSGGGYYAEAPAATTTQPVSIPGDYKAPWNEAAARAELEANNPLTDRWRQDVTLSPEQQRLLDLQNQAKSLYGTTALEQLKSVQGALSTPFSPTLPAAPTGLTSQGGALTTGAPTSPTLNTNLPSAAGQLQYNAPTLGALTNVASRAGQVNTAAPTGPSFTNVVSRAGDVDTSAFTGPNFANVASRAGQVNTTGPTGPNLATTLPDFSRYLQYVAPTLGPQGTVQSRAGELFGGTLTAPELQSNAPSGFAATLPEQRALELAYASRANELARTFGGNVPGIQYGIGDAGEILRNVDPNASARDRVEEALFGRLNPQIEQTRLALETRLRNQGLAPGGEAWMNSLNDIQRQENDARLAVIAQAGQEQSRQLGMDLSRGQFTNAAQQQAFAQEVGRQQAFNAAQQQGFGQSRDVAAFGNQAVMAAQGLDSQAMDSRNTARNQMFGQSVQAAQIANDAAARNAQMAQQAEQMRLNAQLAQFNAQVQAAGFQNAQAGQAQQMDLASGGFNNQAALAQFGAGMQGMQAQNAALQTGFGMNQAAATFGNAAQQQMFGNRMESAKFGNDALAQSQALDVNALGFNNTAQQQGFTNQLAGQQARNTALAQSQGLDLGAFGFNNTAAQQVFGNRMESAKFGNEALSRQQALDLEAQGFNRTNATTAFDAGLKGMEAANAAVKSGFDMNANAAVFNNTALQRGFENSIQAATFGNQALGQRQTLDAQAQQAQAALRQAALQEQLTLRSVPMNETAALFGQAGVQYPQFNPVPAANVATTDVLGAYGMAQNAAQAAYNTQAQQAAANTSGLFGGLSSLGGAGIMAYALSDERAKENIREVGELDNGLPVYLFNYKGSPTPQIGLMAQDVEKKKPGAVAEGADGYKRVNYAMAAR